jgi:RnfABCDGE-type electron transport complex B subunit
MEILIPVLIAIGIAVVCGVILTVASILFAVKEDEKFIAIRDCLPGANCGACGYNGCDGYAEALSNGDAAPNLCVPGGSDTAVKISALLGIDSVAVERRVAYVHCNGTHDVTVTNADYDGYRTCAAMCLAC